jgi:hypothetical protein
MGYEENDVLGIRYLGLCSQRLIFSVTFKLAK